MFPVTKINTKIYRLENKIDKLSDDVNDIKTSKKILK